MANCKKCDQHIYWKRDGVKADGRPRYIPHDDEALQHPHECPNRNATFSTQVALANDHAELQAQAVDASGVSLLRLDQKLDRILEILETVGVQL